MRIDDYKSFLKFIKSLDKKPKLLLHACCAPCSSHCIMVLKKYFDPTLPLNLIYNIIFLGNLYILYIIAFFYCHNPYFMI